MPQKRSRKLTDLGAQIFDRAVPAQRLKRHCSYKPA